MRRFCIAPTFLSISCPSRLLVFRARHGTAQVCPLSRRVSVRVHRWRKDGWWKMYRWVWVFFFLTLSHSSPWKQPPEIFVSGSLITRKARVWVFLHLACLCVRVTDWFSLFGFSFRWVFARVLLIPQKPRRSKGADGKNSQSEPAWIPWKIPLSVREPASLTLHLSLSLNGVVPAVRTLANCNLHLSFISAWLPFCQGILRHF